MLPGITKVAVVDDDAALCRSLCSAFGAEGIDARSCGGLSAARMLLGEFAPDLVLLDVAMPDGDGFAVIAALEGRRPRPLVVAMSGVATPEESFRLAERGVRAYVPKPFGMDELRRAIERSAEPPRIATHLAALVGHRSLLELEDEIRSTVVAEAMARTRGSRRAAARLLGISRQLLQYVLGRARA